MPGEQTIKCEVKNCKFNDHGNHCTKPDIQVGRTNTMRAISAAETECDSFMTN